MVVHLGFKMAAYAKHIISDFASAYLHNVCVFFFFWCSCLYLTHMRAGTYRSQHGREPMSQLKDMEFGETNRIRILRTKVPILHLIYLEHICQVVP